MLAEQRTDRPPTPSHRSPPGCFHTDRSPLTTALTNNLLDALTTTNKTRTAASTTHLLGAFGLTDNIEDRVQRLDAEPANGAVQRLQTLSNAATIALQSVATALLAQRRTDRAPTTPHRSPPGCFHTDRSPLATALTDNLLGALATTDKTETLPQQITSWVLSE